MSKFIERKANIIEHTDPERIYVENIRAFFNLPKRAARLMCDLAVRQKYFRKKYAINCRSCGRVIGTVDSIEKLPSHIHCEDCELEERDEKLYDFKPTERDTLVFYQVIQ